MVRLMRQALLLAVFALTLIMEPSGARALMCGPPPPTMVALCINGTCDEGFVIGHNFIGHYCETVQQIEPNPEFFQHRMKTLRPLIAPLDLNGVYQIAWPNHCLRGPHPRNCDPLPQAKRLSSDATPAALIESREAWQTRIDWQYRKAAASLWLRAGGFAAGCLLVILMPWLLPRRWLERRAPLLATSGLFLLVITAITGFVSYWSWLTAAILAVVWGPLLLPWRRWGRARAPWLWLSLFAQLFAAFLLSHQLEWSAFSFINRYSIWLLLASASLTFCAFLYVTFGEQGKDVRHLGEGGAKPEGPLES